MKPHNKLPEPQIGQKFGDWTVVEIGQWASKPEKSMFYKFWVVLISLALQIELFMVPLVIIRPSLPVRFAPLFLILNLVWVVNILIKS